MKNILLPIIIIFFSFAMQGQGVTPEGVKIALDRMLFIEENNELTVNTLTKVREAVKAKDFSAKDYDKLAKAYKTLEGNYNRMYLARMKQDLTNYKQLKSLSKDPNKHFKKYAEDFNNIIGIYNNTFLPVVVGIVENKKYRSFNLNFDADGPTDDCDGDGIEDQDEDDCNENGIPDDCETADCDCPNPEPDCAEDFSVNQDQNEEDQNEDDFNEEENFNSEDESEQLERESQKLNNESSRLNNEESRNRIAREKKTQDLELKRLKTDVLSNKINMFSSAFQVVQTGLDIVNNTTQMVQDTRRERRNLVQMIADEANDMFTKIGMPSWESLELERPGGAKNDMPRNNRRDNAIAESDDQDDYDEYEEGEDDEEYVDEPYEGDDEEYAQEEQRKSYRDEEAPPANGVLVESISGEVYFEIFDNYSGKDLLMPIQNGRGTEINVPRYDIETDLIVRARPQARAQLMSMETTVHPFETVETYPAGTYYRVKASGDAYIYAFSINSGNKMYGFYPYQGEINEIPAGIRYKTPNNTYFDLDDTHISIPDRENYIMISNTPGQRVPVAETLVVLFSRSELNLKDIFRRMERMSERLSAQERLAHIFGNTAATPEEAGVRIVNDKLRFELSGKNKVVLPIVYSIKRR